MKTMTTKDVTEVNIVVYYLSTILLHYHTAKTDGKIIWITHEEREVILENATKSRIATALHSDPIFKAERQKRSF